MSKDLVKLNWDLVKQADGNASRHNEVMQKVADISEYMQDPDIQNAMMTGGAGVLGGAAMGALGEKDDDESRAWKILKNALGYGGAAALMGYGAGPASRALGGPDDPLGGIKDWGKEQYDNFRNPDAEIEELSSPPPMLDPNTPPAQSEPFNPANLVPEGMRPPAPTPPMPQGQGPLLPPPKTGSATDLVKRLGTSMGGPEITKERKLLEEEKREKALSHGKDDKKDDDKKDEEKEALFMGAGIGALIGTMKAREGEKLRGAGYGAGIGAGTELGVGLGSSAGVLAGGALGGLAGGPLGSLAGAGIGGLVGAGGGGVLGYRAGQGIAKDVGESSSKGMPWGPAPDEEEDEAKAEEKEGAAIGAYFAKVSVNAAKWEDKSRKKKRSKVRISDSGQAHVSKKKKKVKSAADNSPKVKQATPPPRRKATPLPARPKTPAGTTRSA